MRTPLSRRTFLKASGVSLALPMLESMNPVAGAEMEPPRRLVFICTALGLHPQSLWPQSAGAKYETTEYLKLLQEHRGDFTLFSGLQHDAQAGRQPHNCEITWLTAARGPGLDGFKNTISVDQVAAGAMGYATRFPSITLGSRSSQSQSYTSNGVMIPAETSPARLFARLFLQGNARQVAQQKQRLRNGRSILDQLATETRSLRRSASKSDNKHLDEYFESVRQAETELAQAEGWLSKPKPQVDVESPQDVTDHRDLSGRMQLLMNMLPLIIQTDSSRVISVMIQDHQSVPQVDGVSVEHHNLSHHGQDPSKIAQLRRIEAAILKCFSSLLGQMKDKSEAGTRLLDNTSILFGSNLGNANSHDPRNLPIFLAGGGYNHGRYLPQENQQLSNLFVTMLQSIGMQTDAFGQSTGNLTW